MSNDMIISILSECLVVYLFNTLPGGMLVILYTHSVSEEDGESERGERGRWGLSPATSFLINIKHFNIITDRGIPAIISRRLIQILPSFTHPYVMPNPYDFLSFVEQKNGTWGFTDSLNGSNKILVTSSI